MIKGYAIVFGIILFIIGYTLCLELVTVANTGTNILGLVLGFTIICLAYKGVMKLFKSKNK